MKNTGTAHKIGTDLNGLDLMKFLCAYLVCMIHIPPCLPEGPQWGQTVNFWLQQGICRIAVPFYFTCSGFLLFRKTDPQDPDLKRLRDYCTRMIRLLGLYHLLLFAGGKGHLWYLGATVVAVCLVWGGFRMGLSWRGMGILASALYLLGLLGECYGPVVAPLLRYRPLELLAKGYTHFFTTTRNGLFFGFPYVLLGTFLARRPVCVSKPLVFVGLGASLAVWIGEIFWLRSRYEISESNTYLLLPAVTFFLFELALRAKLPDSPLWKRLRTAGVLIYYLHMLVYSITSMGISVLDKYLGTGLMPLTFLLSALTVTVLAFVLETLSRRENFRFLGLLWS